MTITPCRDASNTMGKPGTVRLHAAEGAAITPPSPNESASKTFGADGISNDGVKHMDPPEPPSNNSLPGVGTPLCTHSANMPTGNVVGTPSGGSNVNVNGWP